MPAITPGITSQTVLAPSSSQPGTTPFVLPDKITVTKNSNDNLKSGFGHRIASFLFSGKKTQPALNSQEKNRAEHIDDIKKGVETLIRKKAPGNELLHYLCDALRAGFTFEEIMPKKFIDSNTEAMKLLVAATGEKMLGLLTSDKEVVFLFNNIINKLYNSTEKGEIVSNKSFLSKEMFCLLSDRTTMEKPLVKIAESFQDTLRMKNKYRSLVESYSAAARSSPPKSSCMSDHGFSAVCTEIRHEVAGENYSRLSAEDIADHLNIINIAIAEVSDKITQSSQQREGLSVFFEYVDCIKTLLKTLHSSYHKIDSIIESKATSNDAEKGFYYLHDYKFEGNIERISVPRIIEDKIFLFDVKSSSTILDPKINSAITAIDRHLQVRYFGDE
ncbi:hypothetical protein [Pantoea cypripedii]|uniref:Uncharacterized protein n=1 Tax=Pantoea cypripedii TaxID=55209 RepID=A0A6B9GFP2_PANCY|nr:hypothetical protein [Pantoea cypripedii]QGY32235.1 hypothetical protein CUN67_24915 [Pantoea cypripedii]